MAELQFDFEVGSLSESPCKKCKKRDTLPDCIKECKIIAEFQRRIVSAVSCNPNSPIQEGYRVIIPHRTLY
jgi:hypothetical protein